eukprot:CAMPEP_0178425148 /NCGR_PEP_ID=MMETSP0689_2-20121128/28574_1 /TAXON_ID=160604 /ORGANISM="Amphidinium massartii, Strain CS-259" /LENGTH=348 /DNA_ID=CAMNT_0020046803 /DNA_START=107 /DNA_END=1153 /DNA_ORIENTATION=-
MSTYGSSDVIATEPKRPGIRMAWNEVRAQVQQPNGSVRTSPRLAAAVSPPTQTSAVGQALAKPVRQSFSSGFLPFGSSGLSSSRGGSSRGGSSDPGKSSRSSSRDGRAREGDISSRPSSGGSGWETSTNSSEASRPRTPPDLAPSPMGDKALLMPNPMRTTFIIQTYLSDEEHVPDGKPDGLLEVPSSCSTTTELAMAGSTTTTTTTTEVETRIEAPIALKWDPYGRDIRRCDAKIEACSVQPLTKYLEGVRTQIDSNLQNGIIPSNEKLDKFVDRLVKNLNGQLKSAPHKSHKRKALQGLFVQHFKRFWKFRTNEKVRTPNPEELKGALTGLIDSLGSDSWHLEQSH